MGFARLIVMVQMLLLGAGGLAYFIWPQEMANISGTLLMTPAAVTDVRAWYGGLQLGLAAFLGLALSTPALLRAALTLQVLLLSTVLLARIGGLWLDGGAQQSFNLAALLVEAVAAGLSFWALRGLNRA